MAEVDSLILGQNPFSGVDHYLAERAREKFAQLRKEQISRTMLRAFQFGATGFNFLSSPAGYNLVKMLPSQAQSGTIGLYPMIPDILTYTQMLSSKGTSGMIIEALGTLSWANRAKAVVQGGMSIVTMDPIRVMKIFLDVEIRKLQDITPSNASLKAVLIHESITDRIVSLGAKEIVRAFVRHLKENYSIMPGFTTLNFARFVEFWKKCDLPVEDVVVMTPFNKLGFQMSPTKEACEKALLSAPSLRVIAMSILAAGQLKIEDAIDYLSALKSIRSVVVGVSSETHAAETFGRLGAFLNGR